ncbi:ComEC/Rec2 family competence protein, partial [Streptomyces sp. NPDC004561]
MDLRLVPPALAAWATAALLLDAPVGWTAGITVVCLVGGVALLSMRRAGRAGRTGRGSRGGEVAREGPARGWPAWARASVAAVLLCVAAAAASAGLHGADVRRGPVPELARRFATVTAEVEVTGDPWLSRPRVRGDHSAPVSVLVRAEVRRVEESEGRSAGTRAPVLMVIDGDVPAPEGGAGPSSAPARSDAPRGSLRQPPVTERSAARSGGAWPPPDADTQGGRGAWLRVLPSTRLWVRGQLAPALVGGDRTAAVLRVRGRPGPRIVAGPSGPQRLAGRLRDGLREAAEGLPGDARGLLPGLVVGDTSRITPELDDAFKETDLAHTLAVSGSNLTILLALLIGPPGLAQQIERRGIAPRLGLSLRATALLAGVLTLGFVVVCRPDPSVLRAAACGVVALLALATGRRRSLLPALATAVLLLVLYDPWLARSYGFLLSVLATGALLVVAPGWT